MKLQHILYQGLIAFVLNIFLLAIRLLAPKWLLFKFVYELLLILSVFGTPVLLLWALFRVFIQQEQDSLHWLAIVVLLLALGVMVVVVLPSDRFGVVQHFLLP
ncbi:MAG: hypothetical protein ACOVQA_03725 [Thermoflexibacteraceae bacterium]|jgi:hypothetical protein